MHIALAPKTWVLRVIILGGYPNNIVSFGNPVLDTGCSAISNLCYEVLYIPVDGQADCIK